MRTPVLFSCLCCFFLVIELVCAGAASRAEAQPVRISASHDSLRAGQLFDIYIVFEGSSAFDRVVFPDSARFTEPFEYRSSTFGLTDEQADSARITLQFFGAEDTVLEDLYTVGIRGNDTLEFELPPVEFYFRTTLAEEDELRPLKPIFAFAASLIPWILGALLIALLAGGFWYWYRHIRKPEPEPQPLALNEIPEFSDPLRELRRSIARLRRKHEANELDTEEFYIQYSDALRGYYERLYGFPALEQTTREVIQALKGRHIYQPHIELAEALLTESDMVKFARYKPGPERITEMLEQLEIAASQLQKRDRGLVENMRIAYYRKHAPQSSENTTPSQS